MNTDKIYAESIANEYSVKNDTKVLALKKLDRKVKEAPLAFALILGVLSTLVLGTGMCLAMGAIGSGTRESLSAGIALGVAGMTGMAVNYPVYKRMLAGRRGRYAGDIIRLANEITGKA